MKPHKHAELIKAWADGAEIERREIYCRFDYNKDVDVVKEEWIPEQNPTWVWNVEYRIKPEPKPDVVMETVLKLEPFPKFVMHGKPNLKLTFDGETGELKSAEVLK